MSARKSQFRQQHPEFRQLCCLIVQRRKSGEGQLKVGPLATPLGFCNQMNYFSRLILFVFWKAAQPPQTKVNVLGVFQMFLALRAAFPHQHVPVSWSLMCKSKISIGVIVIGFAIPFL